MRKIDLPKHEDLTSYAKVYTKLVPTDDLVLQHLNNHFTTLKSLILSLPQEVLQHRYAEGKWTLKEMLVHMIDTERVFSYRAMCFARGEQKKLSGFEQNEYASFSDADRSVNSILEEYEAVRNATITLFNGLSDAALQRTGVASDKRISVGMLVYHIAGHELHHIDIIRSKYLRSVHE